MQDILDASYFKNTQKEKYSFPKSNRFPDLKPQYLLRIHRYTIDYYDKD